MIVTLIVVFGLAYVVLFGVMYAGLQLRRVIVGKVTARMAVAWLRAYDRRPR